MNRRLRASAGLLALAAGLSLPTLALAQATEPAAGKDTVDHSKMDHSKMDHSKMDHSKMGHAPAPAPATQAAMQPREPIPALTDADRAAAFPQVAGHAAHGQGRQSYWLVDRLEIWDADGGAGLGWETGGWFGGDLNRLWLRTEGEREGGSLESGSVEVLYGRSISRWWDVVAGVRHDLGEAPSQTFAAIGVVGLAPYKFEVEATAYIGQGGQTAATFEAEYDTLLTGRLIAQWHAEANLFGREDPGRGLGAGLATVEAGLRLRYEISRRFAPYVGVVWEQAQGETARMRRDNGEHVEDTRLVAGFRFWF